MGTPTIRVREQSTSSANTLVGAKPPHALIATLIAMGAIGKARAVARPGQ